MKSRTVYDKQCQSLVKSQAFKGSPVLKKNAFEVFGLILIKRQFATKRQGFYLDFSGSAFLERSIINFCCCKPDLEVATST